MATRGVVLRGIHPQSHPLVSYDRTENIVYCAGTFADSMWVGKQRLYGSGLHDVFLAAFDSNLDLLWMQRMGGPADDSVTCMSALPTGGVALGLMCGGQLLDVPAYTIGTTTFTGHGGYDAVVTTVARDGTVQWTRADGAESAEFPTALVAHDGDVYVTGTFVGKSRFGTTNVADDGRTSAYLQRISPTGESQWVLWTRGIQGSQGRGRAEGGKACSVVDDKVSIVSQVSSAIRWGTNTIESTSFAYETMLTQLTATTNGVEAQAELLSPCRGDSCPTAFYPRTTVSLVSEYLNCISGNEVGIGFHSRDRSGTSVDLRFPVGGARTVVSATANGLGDRILGSGKFERTFSFTSTQLRPDIFTENLSLQDGFCLSVLRDGTGDWAMALGASNWSTITSCAQKGTTTALVAAVIGQVKIGTKTLGESNTDTLGVLALYEATSTGVRDNVSSADGVLPSEVALPIIDVLGKHVGIYLNSSASLATFATLPYGLYAVLGADGTLRRLLIDRNGTVRIAE